MLIREGRRHILVAAQKPAGKAAEAPALREPSLHPAFDPVPSATRRARTDRRAVRPPVTPIVTI